MSPEGSIVWDDRPGFDNLQTLSPWYSFFCLKLLSIQAYTKFHTMAAQNEERSQDMHEMGLATMGIECSSHNRLVYAETSWHTRPTDDSDSEYPGDCALSTRPGSAVENFDISPLATASLVSHSVSVTPDSLPISTIGVLPHEDTASINSRVIYTTPESVDIQKEKAHKSSQALHYMVEWWLWEFCGMSLSIGSIIAVIYQAINLDGTLLTDWTSDISPNTVISALVTLAKTSMLLALAEGLSQAKWLYFWNASRALSNVSVYEDASRGPWGSLKFLFLGLRRKSPIVAWMGALLAVLVLAMGPSAQQIVAFDTQTVRQRGVNSSIFVSKIYTIRNYSTSENISYDIFLKRALQRALVDGLFNEEIPLSFTCQSGNCSWPDFTTLGLCSSCVDVSDNAKVTLVGGYVEYPWNTITLNLKTSSGFHFVYTPTPIQDYMVISENLTTKEESILTEGTVETQIGKFTVRNFDASLAPLAVVQQGVSQLVKNVSNGVNIHHGEPIKPSQSITTTAVRVSATVTECIIRWCARTYQNFTVVHGILKDFTLHKHPLGLVNQDEISRTPLDVLNRNGTSNYYISEPKDDWRHGNAPIHPFVDSIFTISEELVVPKLDSALRTTFQTSGFVDSISGLAFQYGNNVSAKMDVIADSLTKWIQTNSEDSVEVPGTVWTEATVIHIRWVWLTFPVALVVFSAVFLITIAMNSYKHNVPAWKSSLMPLLFHGVAEWSDDEIRDIRQGNLENKSDMERRAKTMNVKLLRNDFGESRFVR
ncbi:hypothetical protein F4860DRAFT_486760 [Xylaria cubensis]|nr:hypothetical protein F4860DRAFT_486760 [Xylaria cubensis]